MIATRPYRKAAMTVWFAACIAAAGLRSAAWASAAEETSQPAAAPEAGLETIMVTAQKQTQNVQQVPIAISTVTAQQIEKAHTVNLEALTGAIPNVQIGHFSNNPNSAVFNIRGMGVIEPDPYAGQTVTVVIDGVPQAFNMISLPDLFDIERIEILRGPQGTLFGANTTGGVVNIITAQPTGRYDAHATASIGNYRRIDANAAFDFPIIEDVLAGKVTVLHHSEDGFVTNIVDGRSMGDQNISAIRGYLRWTASDSFKATLIEEYVRGQGGSPIVVQGGVPGDAEYTPAGTILPGDVMGQYPSPCLPAGHPCHAPRNYYSANSSTPNRSDEDSYATTLTMVGNSGLGEFTSITGYKRFTEDNFTDQDGTVLFLDDTHRTTRGYQVSEELRDKIQFSPSVQLLVGGFYMYDYYHHIQNFRIQFAAPGFRQLNNQDQIRRSESLFVQSFVNLTDKLRFQAGLRGTRETTRMIASIDNFINPAGVATFTGDVPIPGGFVTRGQKSWNNVGGKAGFDYQWTRDMMSYIYYARGFKSGGFVGRVAVPSDIGPYNPEYVQTIELGFKGDWLEHRLRTNAAVFYNKYRDLQLAEIYFTKDVNGNTVNGNSIVNAAQAKTKGVELEISAVPVDGLVFHTSVAYLWAKYSEFPYRDPNLGGTTVVSLAGYDLQNAPHWTASGGFTYTHAAGPGKVSLGVEDRYTGSKFEEALADTPRSHIQPTNYVDGTLDWTPSDGRWSAGFWVRNIADKRYIASVFDAPGTLGLVNYEPPREFGFTVNFNWE